jgi:hypothetical protein
MFGKMEYGKSGRTEGIIGDMVLSDARKVEQICERNISVFYRECYFYILGNCV